MTDPAFRETAAPAQVSRLAYVEMRTPDVAPAVDHYVDVLRFGESGRDGKSVYLTPSFDHHALVVTEGPLHGRARVGFQLRGPLAAAAKALSERGIRFERRRDPEPGVLEDLVLVEPTTGTPLHLFAEVEHVQVATAPALTPTKLGHVAAFVADMPAVRAFYEEVLGFRFSDQIGDFFVFLRCNADHHAINLWQDKDRGGALHHIAFEMRDFAHLKAMLDYLASRQTPLVWGPGRHGPGHNIFTYHRDPDGNFVELFTELDVIHDEQTGAFEPRPWHDSVPQVPRIWTPGPDAATSWGPMSDALN